MAKRHLADLDIEDPPPSPMLRMPGQYPVASEGDYPTPITGFGLFGLIRGFLNLPVINLAVRWLRPHRIYAQSIVREDGARKKRLIDAGPSKFATPRRVARAPGKHSPATPSKCIPGMWPANTRVPNSTFPSINRTTTPPAFKAITAPTPIFSPNDTFTRFDDNPSAESRDQCSPDGPVGFDETFISGDIEMEDCSLIREFGTPVATSTPRYDPNGYRASQDASPLAHIRPRSLPPTIRAQASHTSSMATHRPESPIMPWPVYDGPCPPSFDPTPPNLFGPAFPKPSPIGPISSPLVKRAVSQSAMKPSPQIKNSPPLTKLTSAARSVISPLAKTAGAQNGMKSPPHILVTPVSAEELDTLFPKAFNKRLDPSYLSPKGRGRHTRPTLSPLKDAPLKHNVENSVARQLAITKVADDARETSAAYKAEHEARAKRKAELGSGETSKNEIADLADLSHLSTASYENDLSTLPDAPTPPPKKTVTWPKKVRAKSFFRDSLVADMQDSVLEDIKNCPEPGKARARLLQQQQASPQNSPTSNQVRTSNVPSFNVPSFDVPSSPSSDGESGGFRGVPPETFYDSEEDSLEESKLSTELVCELYQEVEKKLLLSTPPQPAPAPPTPTIKPLVSSLTEPEILALDAAVKQSDDGKITDAKLVKDNADLNSHDFGTLLPKLFNGAKHGWVNDNIVNEYLRVLVDHQKEKEGYKHKKDGPAPPVHAFRNQFINSFSKNKTAGPRWAKKVQLSGENFLKCRLVLFPICANDHWTLLAIKPQDRRIEYYDSLGGYGERYMQLARDYLEIELGRHYIASEWHVSTEQESMRQKNGSDCAVFTVLNALVLLRGEDHKRVVSTMGMEDARKRIAVTLLANKPTTELE